MRFGSFVSGIAILGGLWLFVTPYLLNYRPATGDPWTGPVLTAVIGGLAVAVAAALGLVAYWGLALRDWQRAGTPRRARLKAIRKAQP
jgi:hypothetical protein